MKNILSIIIPTYNNADTITHCLDSIINSFHDCIENIEIIVVNDGSDDGTEELLKKYNELSCFNLIIEKNMGVSSARNLGLSVANGKYVWFIDADDKISFFNGEAFLEKVMMLNAELYIFGFKKIYNLSNGKKRKVEEKNSYSKIYTKRTFAENFPNIFEENEFNVLWNKLYKKSVIDNNDISFVTDIRSGEDAVFNCDYVVNCNSIVTMTDVLIEYSIRNTVNKNYNRAYSKDTKRMLSKMIALTEDLNLKKSFLSNKIIETNKGIIDNIFIKYLNFNDKFDFKNIIDNIDTETLGYKVNFMDLSKKNKFKYIFFNTKIGIYLRYRLLKVRRT